MNVVEWTLEELFVWTARKRFGKKNFDLKTHVKMSYGKLHGE